MSTTNKLAIKATVFIPTFNGADYLPALLESVLAQKNVNFEVLIIDSGSKDQSVEIIKGFPSVRLHQIPNTEFGHGKTRNLAATMANGEFIVYLSQDAVPANDRWLEFMIEPFAINEKVFCVYGKQVPRPFADATTKREVSSVFNGLGPDHSIMIDRKFSLSTDIPLDQYLTFFSDVNSAVRKKGITEVIPYQNVRYSEDQLLGKDVLDKGLLKAYAPKGVVLHSNEYSIKDMFYRKYDEYLGMHEVLGVLPPHGRLVHVKRAIGDILRDYKFIIKDRDYSLKQKIRNFVGSPFRNYYREKAAYLVSNEKYRNKHKLNLSLEGRRKVEEGSKT